MSKKKSLILLAVASFILSRTVFVFIDDPEGPNLLIVTVLVGVIYGVSLLTYMVMRKIFFS